MLKNIFDSLKRFIHKVTLVIKPIFSSQMQFLLFLSKFLPWIMKNPRSIPSLIRLTKGYFQASRIRKLELKRGVKVPSFLIISITSRCNLKCSGCFAVATGTICKDTVKRSLDIKQWRKTYTYEPFRQAKG